MKNIGRRRKLPKGEREKLKKAPLSEDGHNLLAAYMGQSADPFEREKSNLIAQAKATIKSRVKQAREDPNAFIEYCFKDSLTGDNLVQADFHRQFQDKMIDTSIKDLIAMFPRDHGKTTQLEGFTIWKLGNNPNERIKFVSESDSRAVERLFTIVQHIRSNDCVHDVFPWLKPAKLGDWTKHKIVVERSMIMRDASIEALGVLSTATGGRADTLIADDAVGRRNSIEQPKLRETVKAAWNSDWSNLVEPEGKTIWTCTPWHVSDCTHMLLKNPTYHVLRCPVGIEGDPYQPLWEAKWTRENLIKRKLKIGELEYNRGFRLIALSGEFSTIRNDWIIYWTEVPDVSKLKIFAAFDVSSGESKDFFSCVVIGVDPRTMRVFVLEAWHDKLTFLHRANAVVRTFVKWQCDLLGIEEETMKSLSQYLDEKTLLRIVPVKPKLSKAIRLMGVSPYIERGQVVFNPALNPECIENKEEQGDLVGELTEFPLAANDDLVDALIHALYLAVAYGELEESEDGGASSVNVNVELVGSTHSTELSDFAKVI